MNPIPEPNVTQLEVLLWLSVDFCLCFGVQYLRVQYNGGLLPDIMLLIQCYYHRGTRLNAMKGFYPCSQCYHLLLLINALTNSVPDWVVLV